MATTARPRTTAPPRRDADEMAPGTIVLARYGMRRTSCDGSETRAIEAGEDLTVVRAPTPARRSVGVVDALGVEFSLYPSQLRPAVNLAAWEITTDLMGDEPEVVGTRAAYCRPRSEWLNTVEFALIDDDGEVYYLGVLDNDDQAISQTAALAWGMRWAGACVIKIRKVGTAGSWIQEIG